MSNLSVYERIAAAQDKIKGSKLKKGGRNDYSNYDYFTPEQVSGLVTDACKELKLFIIFNMPRNELGIMGELTILNLDNITEKAIFTMAAEIPTIKATNSSQQLGGAMTYTKRYMLMNVFDIVDNNLDFDNPPKKKGDNKTPPPPPPPKKEGNKTPPPQQKTPQSRGSEIHNKGQRTPPPQQKIKANMCKKKDIDELIISIRRGDYTKVKPFINKWTTGDRGIFDTHKKLILKNIVDVLLELAKQGQADRVEKAFTFWKTEGVTIPEKEKLIIKDLLRIITNKQ